MPYIVHPIGVAKLLIEHDCPEEVVIAGILHDTVEDTSVTRAELLDEFGEKVAHLVEGASEADKRDVWENRKQQFIESLKTADEEVLLVVCADKVDNIRSIREDYAKMGEAVWARFSRPKEKQGWYFRAVINTLGPRLTENPGRSLLKQLQEEVQNIFEDS